MADELSPEQIAELQKKNCIFCKIINGEMEAKKVFENERFLAILDIRPAAPGHILFMPKMHAPIIPLIPEEQMIEFFELATKLGVAAQEALISQKVTIFAASGYAAGQQAPHAILHIIPRDKGDDLDMLDVNELNVQQADAVALSSVFAQATTQALMHRKREDAKRPQPVSKIAKDMSDDELFAFIDGNQGLRTWLLENPEELATRIPENPRLSQFFKGVDVLALSRRYKERAA